MRCDKRELEAAQKILLYSRRRISSLCPLLLPAIYALRERVRDEPGAMFTDGVSLWFWPGQVLEDFRLDQDLPAKRLLHMTLHCLLGHLPMRQEQLRAEPPPLPEEFSSLSPAQRAARALSVFDTVADHKAARWMTLLCGTRFYNPDCLSDPDLPFSQLYQSIISDADELRFLSPDDPEIALDDHKRWSPKALAVFPSAGPDEGLPAPDWQRLLGQMAAQAKRSPQWGHLAGELESELRLGEESPISYTRFLRRFASPRERMFSDPDSIDFRWYHVGLELYGDIPLLEPTELSEPPLPDDLVLAVDTSGSCGGEVCRRFLRETASLLRDLSVGSSSFRILLLQCDTEIQQEFLLTSPDQLARLSEEFCPQGFGGTDFTPVFQRLEELRRDGTLPRVQGLLYLSDGYGDFPEEDPGYPVAFLLPEEEDEFGFAPPDMPPWVTPVQLHTNDFTVKETSL